MGSVPTVGHYAASRLALIETAWTGPEATSPAHRKQAQGWQGPGALQQTQGHRAPFSNQSVIHTQLGMY